MSSISISKYQHLYHQITPAKVTVPHDINSWLETQAKHKIVYKYKPRKTLKKIDQHSHENSQNQPKMTNLAELRAYRQKLLKSSAKKMSDRCIPSTYSHAQYSLELLKSKRSGLNMKIRSLSRPRHELKEQHIIVVTQFETNDAQSAPAAQLNLNFKFHNKMNRMIVKTLNSQREATLLKRRKTISRNSLKNNPEMSIGFNGVQNPQEKGIGLMSRRLLPSKA